MAITFILKNQFFQKLYNFWTSSTYSTYNNFCVRVRVRTRARARARVCVCVCVYYL